MASVFDLMATLSLSTEEYESKLKEAGNLTDSEAKKMAQSFENEKQKSINSMKTGISVAAAAGAAAIGAFAVSSVKAGAEFDKSMSQVAATMGKTTDEIKDLRDFAQEMGSKTAFSATESAEALNYMALAGYDAETSMKMLPNVLNLAAAGGIDLASASDMVTDAQSALGLSLEETNAMVDQMASASSHSNTSVAQLGEAMLTIGATARGVKGGTQELSTVLGALADNGIKGAEGGTHLRNMIISLQTPTKDGIEALSQLGMSYADMYDEVGNMRSLPEIFEELDSKMEGMTQQSKDAIVSGIFNKTDLAAANALIGTSKERFGELSGAIGESQGAAQKMADTQLDNLEGDITLLKSAFEGLQIGISDDLSPAFRGLVQLLTKAIENFDTIGPIVLGVATAFGVFAVAINMTAIIDKVTKAMAAFNAVLAANPIGIVVALIAGLIVAIAMLWKKNEKFRDAVMSIFNAVASFVGGVVNKIKTFFTVTVPGAIDKMVAWFKAIPGKIKAIPGKVIGFFQKMPGKIVKVGKDLLAGLWKGIKEKFTWLKDKVMGKIDEIKGWFTDLFEIHSPSRWAAGIGVFLMMGLAQGIEDGSEDVESSLQTTLGNMKSLISSGIAAIEQEIAIMEKQAQDEAAAEELANYQKSIEEKKAQMKKEPQNRKQILDEIAQLEADWNKKQKEAARQAEMDKAKARLEELKNFEQEYLKAWDEINNKQTSLSSKLSSFGTLFEKTQSKLGKDVFKLNDLNKQIEAIEDYSNKLEDLRNRGLSEGLFNEIIAMSVEDAQGVMEQLGNMTDESLAEFQALYEKKQVLAESISKKVYESEFDKLDETMAERMPDALKAMFESGQALMESMAGGVDAGSSSFLNAVQKAIARGTGGALSAEATKSEKANAQTQLLTSMYNSVSAQQDKNMQISVQIDGKEVAKATRGYNDTITKQRGKSMTGGVQPSYA